MPRSASEVDKYVGRRLAGARREAGLSQHALGRAIHTSYQQVQKYENGTNRISAGTLLEVSKLLNLPVSYFFEHYAKPEVRSGRGPSDLLSFATTAEGIELLQTYLAIKTPEGRKQALKLLKALTPVL